MAKKKATKKKAAKPNYLREIHVSYKKKRVSSNSPINKSLTNPELVVELFKDMQNETKEKLIAISLDVKLKIITFEVVSIGSVAAIYARPGELVRVPVMVNAYGIIAIHNHPSGDSTPSDGDHAFTDDLLTICKALGTPLYDHIIIGDGEYFSFAQEGLLERE